MKKTIIISLVLTFLLCGCNDSGSSQTGSTEGTSQNGNIADSSNSSNAEDSGESDDRAYTLDMYLKIGMDTSYEDVCAVLGDPGEVSVDGDVLKQYIWENEDGSNISVTFDSNKVTAKTQAYLGPFLRGGDKVTKNMFHQLSEGSSLSEAEEILGKGTETLRQILSGEESVTYQWSNSDGSGITIVFQNGKASKINDLMLD